MSHDRVLAERVAWRALVVLLALQAADALPEDEEAGRALLCGRVPPGPPLCVPLPLRLVGLVLLLLWVLHPVLRGVREVVVRGNGWMIRFWRWPPTPAALGRPRSPPGVT